MSDMRYLTEAIVRLERQAAKTQAALQAAITALEKVLAELPQLLAAAG